MQRCQVHTRFASWRDCGVALACDCRPPPCPRTPRRPENGSVSHTVSATALVHTLARKVAEMAHPRPWVSRNGEGKHLATSARPHRRLSKRTANVGMARVPAEGLGARSIHATMLGVVGERLPLASTDNVAAGNLVEIDPAAPSREHAFGHQPPQEREC